MGFAESKQSGGKIGFGRRAHLRSPVGASQSSFDTPAVSTGTRLPLASSFLLIRQQAEVGASGLRGVQAPGIGSHRLPEIERLIAID